MHINLNLIKTLLDEHNVLRIKKILKNNEIPDIAILIDQLSDSHKIKIYLMLPTIVASEVLLEISQHSRKFILKSLKDKYIVSMINKIQSDDSADILAEVPEHQAKRIIAYLPKKKKDAIEPLIKYEEDTAGGIMQSELVSLQGSFTITKAIQKVKSLLQEDEGINYIYIVDSNTKLKGVVSIQALLSTNPNKKLSSIMSKDIVKLAPELDKERVAEIFRKEDIFALPVVDKKGKLLGRVTVDDVLDVIEEEATEDMFKLAGVHPDEHVYDPFSKSLKRRFPWLFLNLFTSILAAITISLFTETLETIVILAAFMPIIAGMGGNSGAQTITLIIRGIALHQVDIHNYRKVLGKELSLGLVNGLILGIVMGVIGILWTSKPAIGIVILAAMVINMSIAGIISTSTPFVLKYFKFDPAVSSAVFVTTFTDIIGFFSFLGIATLMINWLL